MHWVAVSWTVAMFSVITVGNITVIQSPRFLIKALGQTADLGCTYEGPTAVGSSSWHKGTKQGNDVSNTTAEFRGRVFEATQEDFSYKRDASIRIINLKAEDTGFYVCKVELVEIGAAYGAGTTVTVNRDEGDAAGNCKVENKSNIPSYAFALAVVVPLLIIAIVIAVVRRRQKSAARELPARSDRLCAEVKGAEPNCVSFERSTNQREGDDKMQYAQLNLQESRRTERCLNQQAVLYATVKSSAHTVKAKMYPMLAATLRQNYATNMQQTIIEHIVIFCFRAGAVFLGAAKVMKEPDKRLDGVGMVAGSITVIQNPMLINATEGQSVLLNCTYEGPSGVGVFKWYKNNNDTLEVSEKSVELRGRVSRAIAEVFRAKREASITVTDLMPYDSGIYYCHVEVLGPQGKCGPGTTLNVLREVEPITEKPTTFYTHLYTSARILGVFILFFACYSLMKDKYQKNITAFWCVYN
ncbi:uncharacterized protein LOC119975537 [Scyliorhinus canicula]|uniref:uncharacterized protein LOC119975537 n=1 Tax=Scyliorhinus canicula TaxID=7830 RepID=UPI0018F536FB|nr:uncharacterized protein LOC119975537 [Scyliorhinus canicula]